MKMTSRDIEGLYLFNLTWSVYWSLKMMRKKVACHFFKVEIKKNTSFFFLSGVRWQ
jgi:hypothetical protein